MNQSVIRHTTLIMRFTGCDTPSHKEMVEAKKYPIAHLSGFSFSYIKGSAYGKATYIVVEDTTGMEFCRAGTFKQLDNAVQSRIKAFSIPKIETLIKEMQYKYKELPVLEIAE